jgi:exoribonuclease II
MSTIKTKTITLTVSIEEYSLQEKIILCQVGKQQVSISAMKGDYAVAHDSMHRKKGSDLFSRKTDVFAFLADPIGYELAEMIMQD